MSNNLNSKPFSDPLSFLNPDALVSAAGEPTRSVATVDNAIDAALRSVPLPDGLMTRLGKLVYTMPDETADQVDWLGC